MKQIHNKVVGSVVFDGDIEVEGVTSVTTPDLEFQSDEIDVPGTSAAVNIINPAKLSAMTATINHNNGNGCAQLKEPRRHKIEFRAVQQVLDVATGRTEYQPVKYRFEGEPMKSSNGDVEQNNPISGKVEYSLFRYEEEIGGHVVTLVDALAGILVINGKNYTDKIKELLY